MRWIAPCLLLLGLAALVHAADGDPAPELLEGPAPPPAFSFGTACCQPAQRNWWYVPPHAPHLGWQGYCGECNFQMPFGGCPRDYAERCGCGPIDRLGYGVRSLLFGDDSGCRERGCGCAKAACGCERPACEKRPVCGCEPACGCESKASSGDAGNSLTPPSPPPLETELPQSKRPTPLRAVSLPRTAAARPVATPAREPATIRTATHIELPGETSAEPRLLTPPVSAQPALSAPPAKRPVVVTPATRQTPAIPKPSGEAPQPISGNSLRFRLVR